MRCINFIAACAMYHRDSDTIREQCRALINTYQFNNEPLRLLLVSLGGGFLSTEAFINTRLQKHLIRELRTAEEVVKGKDAKWNAISGRWVVQSGSGTRDDAEEGLEEPVVAAEKSRDKAPLPKPTQGNPIHMGVYGMLCSCAKSYSSALCECEPAFGEAIAKRASQSTFCRHMTIITTTL